MKHHEATAAWVEVTEDYSVPDWQYREAEGGEDGGVLINLPPQARSSIREGLVKSKIERRTAEATTDVPVAPRKAKASYSEVLCEYIAHHKTLLCGVTVGFPARGAGSGGGRADAPVRTA